MAMKLRYRKRLDVPYPEEPLLVTLTLPASEMGLLILTLACGYHALEKSCAFEGFPEDAPKHLQARRECNALYEEITKRREAAEVEAGKWREEHG